MGTEKYVKINAKFLKSQGNEIFTHNHLVFLELIKNSYDAEAKKVRIILDENREIIIIDDGIGMNEIDFDDLAYMDKSKKKLNEEITTYFGEKRVCTGSKGNGFYSIAKLAKKVQIFSKKMSIDNGENEILKYEMDFKNAIEDEEEMTKILLNSNFINKSMEEKIKTQKHGTIIRIEILEEWKTKDFASLFENLRKKLSFLTIDKNFQVHFLINKLINNGSQLQFDLKDEKTLNIEEQIMEKNNIAFSTASIYENMKNQNIIIQENKKNYISVSFIREAYSEYAELSIKTQFTNQFGEIITGTNLTEKYKGEKINFFYLTNNKFDMNFNVQYILFFEDKEEKEVNKYKNVNKSDLIFINSMRYFISDKKYFPKFKTEPIQFGKNMTEISFVNYDFAPNFKLETSRTREKLLDNEDKDNFLKIIENISKIINKKIGTMYKSISTEKMDNYENFMNRKTYSKNYVFDDSQFKKMAEKTAKVINKIQKSNPYSKSLENTIREINIIWKTNEKENEFRKKTIIAAHALLRTLMEVVFLYYIENQIKIYNYDFENEKYIKSIFYQLKKNELTTAKTIGQILITIKKVNQHLFILKTNDVNSKEATNANENFAAWRKFWQSNGYKGDGYPTSIIEIIENFNEKLKEIENELSEVDRLIEHAIMLNKIIHSDKDEAEKFLNIYLGDKRIYSSLFLVLLELIE
ncbi:ATP-binding protein [Williamsoniiplasma luminosum]|uniref:Uncharacterized protein n=1 Tax=Williamsoniiplasma luminosum TaxID=214888 RepID=A0A2S0NJ12_9MOLU|nr:ATP-binding protein [Williamsoniiplasma luminosum]AVP49008.1 MAG: hypothetical protein C5T88_00180 [Williamsoniiplasma luminosum]